MERLNTLIKKSHRHIASAKELSANLQTIEFFSQNSTARKRELIQQLCSTYIVFADHKKATAALQPANTEQRIRQRKRQYQKLENEGTELVVNTPGSYIGATYKGIVVRLNKKEIGKGTAALRHITVMGKGVSISSNALMYCMTHKIPIDFFDGKGKQYASVLSPQFVDASLWNKQAQLPLEKKARLAALIIIGKMKNQLSLIKYYHKYHKGVNAIPLGEKYMEALLRIERKIALTKAYTPTGDNYAADLMAMEAQAALSYWAYIRVLLADDGIDFERREHQGATDLLNSLLNYGYSILYTRVWKTLLSAKLNPSIGILHSPQAGKPTLVFDVVEIFRAQMVDRVVISLIQKKKELKIHDGLLTENTKRTLIRHILERLNRYEKFRKEEMTLSQIILRQSQEIAAYIAGESDVFKPYVAKW